MTGKNNNWRFNWERLPDGSIRHKSGLVFVLTDRDDDDALASDLRVHESSLAAFNEREAARGLPKHDLLMRMVRLSREAGEWHIKNRQ